jgi:predicted DCC family thiol-disulfide oxidoreductase YuxK
MNGTLFFDGQCGVCTVPFRHLDQEDPQRLTALA